MKLARTSVVLSTTPPLVSRPELLMRWQQQGDDDAMRFFELLKGLTFEGAFGDPIHGGNREGQGFRMMGWEPGRGECEPRV